MKDMYARPYNVKKNVPDTFENQSFFSKKVWFSTFLLIGIFLTNINNLLAQASGDYRSNAATMNWNAAASWQKFNGTSWAASTDYPGENACTSCTVTILNGHTVTLNVSPANSVGALVVGGGTSGTLTFGSYNLTIANNLTVNAGATINLVTGNLTVNGTTSTAGTISDANNTGVVTFNGLVTKTAGTWTSTSVTTASNLVFNGGFTNTSGAFNAGAATVGNAQTLTGTTNMSFSNGLVVSGLGDLSIAGTTTNGVTLGGTAINYSFRNLTITGLLTVSTTGNLAVTGTTNITGNGGFTDNNNSGVTSFTGLVTHNSAVAWTSTSVTTAANMIFSAGFTNTAGSFSAGAATIGDNQTLTGTINMSFVNGITVQGNGDLNVAGTASTGVTLGGTAVNYNFRNLNLTGLLTVSTTGNLTVTGTTNITGTGAFTDNNNAGVTSFTGLVTHNSSGAWTSTSVTTPGNMIFSAGFTNTAGTFSAGGATIGDNKTLTGTINMSFTGGLTIQGNGDLNIAGTTGSGVTMGGTLVNYSVRNLNLTGRLVVSTTGNFTVNGTTNITGTGAFTDNENTGITTFNGLITHNSSGAWTSTAVITPANMIFNAGFTNIAGACNVGAATVPNGQTLNGTIVIFFYRELSIGGLGNITFTGSGGVRLGGTLINYTIPGNLTLTGTLLVSTTGNFTVNGTTSIAGAGAFTDNNNTGITTFRGLVTHNSTGAFTTTSVTTPANMVFSAGFTNTAGTFSAGGASIADNQTLTGTVNMSFANGITVSGNGDINIAGTASTGVTLAGSLINYSFRNINITGLLTVSTSGNLTVSGTTTLSGSGCFTDNNGTGITTFTGLVTVGSTSTFTATAVTTVGRLIFAGGIVQNNTTALSFNTGSIRTSASQTFSGAGNINTTGQLDVSTGTLNNNLGGSLIVGGTLSGTTLIQGTNANLSLGSTTPLSITTLTSTATGNTVTYNAAGNATLRGQTYHHLVIAGSGTKTIPATDITLNGNLTISAGILSNTTNNKNISLAGNWTNNAGSGGFAGGTGTVTFNGSSAQTIGGSGTTSFSNLTINNAAGITENVNITVSGTLTLTSGIISTGSNTLTIASTGSVVRTSGHINGNEQRNVATGSNVSRTFDIGDASNYTPATLVFASVSVAGNITVKSTNTDHPNIPSSTLSGSLSVNRYWTITNSGTTFTTYNATLNFLAGDKDASLNTSNISAGRYSSGWTYPTVGTKTATSTQITSISGFGDFILAESATCSTPNIVINDPAAVCKPNTIDLTAASVTTGSDAFLTFTYWTDPAASSSISTPTAVTTSGTYYIKGTSVLGCYDIKPVIVSINSPTGNLSGDATICYGTTTAISIDVTGSGPWSGTLSDGTPFSGSISPLTVNVSPTATRTYTISILTDAACSAQAGDKTGSAAVSVIPLPTTANAGPDQSVCGTNITLAANTPVNGTGSWSIISGTGGSINDPASPTSTFTGNIGVEYILRWTISNPPCNVSSDDVKITITGGLWTGSVSSDWTNAANWCGGSIPTDPYDLILPAGLANYPVITGTNLINDLIIYSGASVNIAESAILTIRGNYSNAGTLSNNGTIVLNGSSQQVFPGVNATINTMKNLEVDNPSGVLLDNSISISGVLTSTDGTITLGTNNITLESDSVNNASVAPVYGDFDYSGGGKFILKKYIRGRRAWHLLTAPVSNANTIYQAWQNGGVYTPGAGTFITGPGGGNGLDQSGSSSFKRYDVNTQALVAVTNTNVSISKGLSDSADNVGYYIFMRGDRNPNNLTIASSSATTLSCSGRLQTGPQTFTAGSNAGNFTLIGNPYAAPVDFNTLQRTNLLKRFYAWDPELNTVGGYVMLDDIDDDGVFSTSVPGSSQTKVIRSHQAIFVQTPSTGPASITFNESDKAIGSNPRVPSITETLNTSIYLKNADGSLVLADGTTAEYNDNYNYAVNYEDAIKLTNSNETIAFLRDGTSLAIERRPLITGLDTLFIRLTKTTQRNYQLKFSPTNMDTRGLNATLRDNYLGTNTPIDLSDVSYFDFTINSDPQSSASNRFYITFNRAILLPVQITGIKAYKKGDAISIDWKTENQLNVSRYEIEKSTDGIHFSLLKKQTATGTNGSAVQYSVLDEHPVSGNNFYRIRSVDISGDSKLSQVVKVIFGKNGQAFSIYPNPVVNHQINLQYNDVVSGNYIIRIINATGANVYNASAELQGTNGTTLISIPQNIQPGIYHFDLQGPDNKGHRQKLILE